MRLPSRLKRSSLGIYHFRVILPKRLRPLYDGRRELKRSLGTRDPRIAKSMAYALNANLDEFLRSARDMPLQKAKLKDFPHLFDKDLRLQEWRRVVSSPGKVIYYYDPTIPGDEEKANDAMVRFEKIAPMQDVQCIAMVGCHDKLDPVMKVAPIDPALYATPLTAEADKWGVLPPRRPIVYSLAVENYLTLYRRGGVKPKTADAVEHALKEFGTFLKEQRLHDEPPNLKEHMVHEITQGDVSDFKLARAKAKESARTTDKKVGFMRTFFGKARASQHIAKGEDLPTNEQTMSKQERKQATGGYEPFVFQDLVKIFDKNNYTSRETQPHWYWIPLISLFTGARIEEICQFGLRDIRREKSVPLFDFNEREGRTLKADACERVIPIHQDLIALGLLDFVDDVTELYPDSARLFPYIPPTQYATLSDSASKAFGRYLIKIGVKDPPVPSIDKLTGKPCKRKCFHSFRSTVNTRLIGKVDEATRCQYIGQKHDTINVSAYGRPLTVAEFQTDVIPKLTYKFEPISGEVKHLDLSPLRYKKGDFKQLVLELMQSKPAESASRKDAIAKRNEAAAGAALPKD